MCPIGAMKAIGAVEAFSPNSKSRKRAAPLSNECPMSSRCVLKPNDDVAEHLKTAHKVQIHEMQIESDGVGLVEMKSDVCIKNGPPRRSAVLIYYDGAVFSWTLESRRRADAETQASVVVQLLRAPCKTKPATNPTTPYDSLLSQSCVLAPSAENLEAFHFGLDSPTSSSSASTSPLNRSLSSTGSSSSSSFFLSSPDWSNEQQHSCTTHNGVRYKITLSVERREEGPLAWEGQTEPSCFEYSQKHERLISAGNGLVALWPTHMSAFSRATGPKENEFVRLTVVTQIERMP